MHNKSNIYFIKFFFDFEVKYDLNMKGFVKFKTE